MPSLRLAAPVLLALACATVAGQAAESPVPDVRAAPVSPLAGPAAPSPLNPGDAFGEEVMLPERTIVYLQGASKWDGALETLIDSFKSLDDYMKKHELKPNGPPMTVFTETDDNGFKFRAAAPLAQAPKDAPKGDIAVGPAPSGKALKFVHRGSYQAMDATYEAITNYLDEKGLEAKDVFFEEYISGPLQANGDALVVNVYVPLK